MDGSWGTDGDHMGEHGRWVHGAEIQLSKCYMFQWGYVLEAQVTQASKRVPCRLLKHDMFQWVVSFKVKVLRLMFHGVWFLTGRNEHRVVIET